MMETIRALSVEIGPRPSATEAEGRAAEYVANALRAAEFSASVEPFGGLRSFGLTYGILYSLFVAAAALAFVKPWPAFVLALIAGLLLVGENGGGETLSRMLPKSPSRNVVGVKRTKGTVKQRLVLTCHLDSAQSGLLWHPKLVTGFRRAFLTMLAGMIGIFVCTDWMALVHNPPIVVPIVLCVCAADLLFSILLLVHRRLTAPWVRGANDDASGVAVMLEAARSFKPAEGTELWCVATGCEESGLVGMARFCDHHAPDRGTTLFINLDNLGAGRIAFTTSEGMLRKFQCDAELISVAREAARSEPELSAHGAEFRTMNNDSLILLQRGYRAISIMAFDSRGVLPNWHWPTDTIERINPDTLATGEELVRRMALLLDGQTLPLAQKL
jgi:hypothetical protein